MPTENVYAVDNTSSIQQFQLECESYRIDIKKYISDDFKGKCVIHFENLDVPKDSLAFTKGASPDLLISNLKISDVSFILITKKQCN